MPGRRNRKPRPAQLAKLPASVVRIASSGRTRRSVAIVRPGWTPGPSHAIVVDGRRGLPCRSIRSVVLLASRDERRVEHGPAEQPLVGRLEERLRVGGDRDRRGGRARAPARLEVDVRPGQTVARHRVAVVVGSLSRDPMTSRASAASSRSRTVGAAPKPAIPRYSAWSFETMSPRRQPAMTGTWRSSAKRVSSVDVRARRTPAAGQDHRARAPTPGTR